MIERLALVVVHHRTPVDTLWACHSLDALRPSPVAKILVDSGSGDDGAARLLSRLDGWTLLPLPTNRGYAAAANAGIAVARDRGATAFAIANSDVVVPRGSVTTLLRVLAEHPGTGIVAPLLVHRDRPDVVESAGISLSPTTGRFRSRDAGAPTERFAGVEPFVVDAASAAFWIVDAPLLDAIGPLDERYFHFFEDIDYGVRATRAGFDIRLVPSATVLHGGGGTLPPSPRRARLSARAQALFLARQFPLPLPGTLLRAGAVAAVTLAAAIRHGRGARGPTLLAALAGLADGWRGRDGPPGD